MKTFALNSLILLFTTSALACPSAALQQGSAQTAAVQTVASEPTLRDVLDHPKKFKDQPITLTGQFFGWKGVCPDSYLKTRSDWVLKTDDACLYVSGQMPPKGLSLTRPKGEKVSVTGVLKLMKHNLPVLEASAIQTIK